MVGLIGVFDEPGTFNFLSSLLFLLSSIPLFFHLFLSLSGLIILFLRFPLLGFNPSLLLLLLSHQLFCNILQKFHHLFSELLHGQGGHQIEHHAKESEFDEEGDDIPEGDNDRRGEGPSVLQDHPGNRGGQNLAE